MSTTTKASKKEEKKEKKEWSKSYERDGVTETIRVKEVENGFIVCKSRWGHDLNSKSSDRYIDEREEYISNVNPIDEEDFDEDIEELLKNFK